VRQKCVIDGKLVNIPVLECAAEEATGDGEAAEKEAVPKAEEATAKATKEAAPEASKPAAGKPAPKPAKPAVDDDWN